MNSTSILLLRFIFHILLTPVLIVIFGYPTNGELRIQIPNYSPKIEYILFAFLNLLVQPFTTFIVFNKIQPNKYKNIEYIKSTCFGILLTSFTLFVLRPVIFHDLFATLLCSIGFGVYCAPLILISIHSTFREMYERHLFLIPSMFTAFVFFASCAACALDTPLAWKFFPTPTFIAFPIATSVSDIYSLIYCKLVQKSQNRTD